MNDHNRNPGCVNLSLQPALPSPGANYHHRADDLQRHRPFGRANLGVAAGYIVIALQSLLKGVGKLRVNEAAIHADVSAAWEVLAEAVQTVMRRYGIENPYEKLKALTRGQAVTKDILLEFIGTLEIPAAEKERLLQLTPESYIGIADKQARDV